LLLPSHFFQNRKQVLKLAGLDLSADRSGKTSDAANPVISNLREFCIACYGNSATEKSAAPPVILAPLCLCLIGFTFVGTRFFAVRGVSLLFASSSWIRPLCFAHFVTSMSQCAANW
jgi:hypothetical protein